MKKTIYTFLSALLIFATVFSLCACSLIDNLLGKKQDDTVIRVGYLTGPTGMGMAKLVSDNGGEEGNDKYIFTKFTDTTKAKDALASNKIDMICFPTNEAASYYTNISNDISVLAINTLSSLFLLTDNTTEINSINELEGKTVYTCKAGTPRIILQYLLDLYDINATVSYTVDGKEMMTPAMLKDQIIAGKVDIAVAPEPIVTASTLQNKNYAVDLDLGDCWDEKIATPLTMGCIIAKTSFVNEHIDRVNEFLNEYKTSIEYISNPDNIESAANYVVETGVMDKAPAAKKALMNLGDAIFYLDGDDMKSALIAFYGALNITVPSDSFFYEK